MSAIPKQETIEFAELPRRQTPVPEPANAKDHSLFSLLLGVIMLAAIMWCVHYLSQPATLPIKHVRITGEFRRLSPNDLQALASGVVRGGFFNINVSEVRDALLQDPWVFDVSVQRIWPDTLRVNVTEQVSVARWGDSGLLNGDGEIFIPEPETFPTDLPLLSGPNGSEKNLLDRYLDLSGLLQPLGLSIDELHLNERRAWKFVLRGGIKVIVGRAEFDTRIKRFIDWVPTGLSERVNNVDEVDMRYTNGFAVRWKDGDSV